MGWQTSTITQLIFNRETYNDIYQIENEIENNDKTIQNIKEELYTMTTSRPEDLLIHNEDMDLLSLQRETKDKLEILEECIIENYKLECLKETFKLRDGDFIENANRKQNIKKWLIDNYILDKSDFVNTNINNSNKENININIKNIEGD